MTASAPATERSNWLDDLNSMLVSTLIHFSILIVLGLLTVAGASSGHSGSIVMTLDGDGGTPGVADDDSIPDGTQLDDPTVLSQPVDLAAAIGPETTTELSTPLASEIAAPEVSAFSSAILSGGGGTIADGSKEGPATEPFGLLGGTGRGGGGSGSGSSTRASTDFFGIGGYGQTFVYVVDASDSMNDRGKFERARYELLHSIEQLKSDQKFFVIFYNEGAYPMDADEPILATPDNVAKITRWIQQIEPTGGTNPLPGLLLGLTMRPDAIYFLSDGQFDPAVIQVMRARNRQNLRMKTRMIPIHTIAFFDRIAEGLMRTIARNSGGEYKYVN